MWSGLILAKISWGAPTLGGEMETQPETNRRNPVVSFPPGKKNKQFAFQARFMRNETVQLSSFPGFSFTLVHLRNNPWKVCVSFLPIFETGPELELELIQTQMTQKPMLWAGVYARALRASQNRK